MTFDIARQRGTMVAMNDPVISRINELMGAIGAVPGSMENEWTVETAFGRMLVQPLFGPTTPGFIAMIFDREARDAVKRHLGVPETDNGVYGHSLHGRDINLYSGKWKIHAASPSRGGRFAAQRAEVLQEFERSLGAVLKEPQRSSLCAGQVACQR